jgi:uncharacterized protein
VTALGADERTRDLPVVGVGVCAGAGYMARAVADDRRLCAFAGVAGYYADAIALAESSPDAYQAAISRGLAAEKRWRDTGETETIPGGRARRRRRGNATARGLRVLRHAARRG